MNRQDRLLILSTFLIGMTIGVYAYFAGFSTVDREITEVVEEASGSLVIVGEAYGGCSRTDVCPTFQIVDDGSYRYFYVPRGASEQVLRTGKIPEDLHDRLRAQLQIAELQVASRPIEPAFCESFVDGIDVRYLVTVHTTEYILDSCGTDVNGDSQMWQTLGQVWTYFESFS